MSISLWIKHCNVEEKEYIPFLTDRLHKDYWEQIADEQNLEYVTLTWLAGLVIDPSEEKVVQEILDEFVTLREHMIATFSIDDGKFRFTLEKTDYFIDKLKSLIESRVCYDRISLG